MVLLLLPAAVDRVVASRMWDLKVIFHILKSVQMPTNLVAVELSCVCFFSSSLQAVIDSDKLISMSCIKKMYDIKFNICSIYSIVIEFF